MRRRRSTAWCSTAEIVALDGGRPAVVQCAAEPRQSQDAEGDRRRATPDAGGTGVLRPAALRGPQPARRAVRRSAPLPVAVPAAVESHPARPRLRRRREVVCRVASTAVSKASSRNARTAYTSPDARSPAWLKIKAVKSAEFVVGGYTRGKGARESLGALLLGYWEGKELRYVGHVGSGLERRRARGTTRARGRADEKGIAVREEAGPASTHDLARAQSGRGGQLRGLDTGRPFACAGVPEIARRHRAAPHPQRREGKHPAARGDLDIVERDRCSSRAARRQGEPDRSRRRRRTPPAHESRSRVLARRSARASSGGNQARSHPRISRVYRPTCCPT